MVCVLLLSVSEVVAFSLRVACCVLFLLPGGVCGLLVVCRCNIPLFIAC